MLTTALVSLFVLVVHGPEVVLCGSSGGRPSSPSYGINPYALTPSYPTESGRRNQGWNSFGKNRRMKDYGTLDQVSQTYIRVMEKMEKYCKTPYEPETDDKIIDMYSQCFSNLIQANKDLVIECRRTIFRSGKQVKEADCSKEHIPKSAHVRICITERMKMLDPNFYFHDESQDEEVSPPREFLNCMDAGFGGMTRPPNM